MPLFLHCQHIVPKPSWTAKRNSNLLFLSIVGVQTNSESSLNLCHRKPLSFSDRRCTWQPPFRLRPRYFPHSKTETISAYPLFSNKRIWVLGAYGKVWKRMSLLNKKRLLLPTVLEEPTQADGRGRPNQSQDVQSWSLFLPQRFQIFLNLLSENFVSVLCSPYNMVIQVVHTCSTVCKSFIMSFHSYIITCIDL